MVSVSLTREELLEKLSKVSSPRYPKNVYRERIFMDSSVRRMIAGHRSGEFESAGVFARLGEAAGLFVIALAEGYSVNDVARVVRISPKMIRREIYEACQRARILGLIPEEEED